MRQSYLMILLGVAMLVGGCANKKYVQQTVQPVQSKGDQVAAHDTQQDSQVQSAQQDIQANKSAISATDEKASTADRRAGEAMDRANAVGQKADQDISQLRGVIANIDDYKVVDQATVHFAFNRAVLSHDDMQQLDDLASKSGSYKRYFVAVEGHADQVGGAAYNLQLSQRRAEAVVQYLAVQKMVPFYMIHTIGVGKQDLADPANTRAARAENRRVVVKVFSADMGTAAGDSANNYSNRR
jgi:OmpA-OmpF porin, OOP family